MGYSIITPDFKIDPTGFLLKCSASHASQQKLSKDALALLEAPTGCTVVDIHFRV